MGILNNFLNALGLSNQTQEFGSFEAGRITWSPDPVRPGDTVKIDYNGLLKESGAKEVYLHYGFNSWSTSPQTIKMKLQDDGHFGTEIQAAGNEVNFCFKDSANNWDNNNGWNWTLHLH